MSKIRINVGGKIFETLESTVNQVPYFNTLLNSQFFKPEEEIFIDRDPKAFREILNYLRGISTYISKKHWRDLEYFGIEIEDEEKEEGGEKEKEEFDQPITNFNNHHPDAGSSLIEFVMLNQQTQISCRALKRDQFLRKCQKTREVMLEPGLFWKDELTLYIDQTAQNLGDNYLIYFDANETSMKLMKSHKDYFDLIDSVTVYMRGYIETTLKEHVESTSFLEYEKCSGDELYVRFLHSQKLSHSKKFATNIVPILVADEKISTKFSEHHPSKLFEQRFIIKIVFNKNYLSIINDIKIRSYGFFVDSNEIYLIDSLTIFRWVKHDEEVYERPTSNISFRRPFNMTTNSNPIKSLFLRLKIDGLKREMMTTGIVKFIEFKLYDHNVRLLHGSSSIHTEEGGDGSFVLWYKFEFDFYLYPLRIDYGNMDISLSNISEKNTITLTSYYYEVLNYTLNPSDEWYFNDKTFSSDGVLHSPNFSSYFIERHNTVTRV